MTRTVFVTGARGKTGREVVAQLTGRDGVEVRAGSSVGAPGTVAFDWADPATWAAAVAGVDAIFLQRPDTEDSPELIAGLAAAAPDAHVVLVSEQGAERVAADGWAARAEAALIRTAGRWTILRPSWFQQVLTDPRFYLDAIRTGRRIALPSGGAPIAWVDTRDIAAVAVRTIQDPDAHHGVAYTLTGPAAITVAGLAAQLSAALGTGITALDPPVEQALAGTEPWLADVLGEMFGRVRDGSFAVVGDAVEKLTGRPPRPVADFVTEHAADWRG